MIGIYEYSRRRRSNRKNYCLYTHSMELRFSSLIVMMVVIRCGIFVSSILNAISLDNWTVLEDSYLRRPRRSLSNKREIRRWRRRSSSNTEKILTRFTFTIRQCSCIVDTMNRIDGREQKKEETDPCCFHLLNGMKWEVHMGSSPYFISANEGGSGWEVGGREGGSCSSEVECRSMFARRFNIHR